MRRCGPRAPAHDPYTTPDKHDPPTPTAQNINRNTASKQHQPITDSRHRAAFFMPKGVLVKSCKVDNCDGEPRAKGYCNRHYLRLKRHGNPLAGAPDSMAGLPLAERFWARVQRGSDGECWEWTGSHTTAGYGNLNRGGGRYDYAHRVSYELNCGVIPPGLVIDHTCRNRGCINPDHLRAVSQKQNNENRAIGSPSNKTSGVRGVAYDKATRSWMTYAGHNGERIYGPRCSNMADAAEAARQLRLALHTHNDADRKQDAL